MHTALILLGSNISPEENVRAAVGLLRQAAGVLSVSSVWETGPVGSGGPNFHNLTVLLETELEPERLKWQVLRRIETDLGRVRVSDKNAPRTIDLDIVVYDDEVLDGNLWKRAYIALPAAELIPELTEPASGRTLAQIATELARGAAALRLGRPSLTG